MNYVQPFKCDNLFKMKNEKNCTYVHRKSKPIKNKAIP